MKKKLKNLVIPSMKVMALALAALATSCSSDNNGTGEDAVAGTNRLRRRW